MYKQMKLLAHLMKLLTDYYQNNEKKKRDGNMNSYMNCVTMTEFFILLQLG
jgi:hypothetical protein